MGKPRTCAYVMCPFRPETKTHWFQTILVVLVFLHVIIYKMKKKVCKGLASLFMRRYCGAAESADCHSCNGGTVSPMLI